MSYHIALKIPGSASYYTYDKNWVYGENINQWIRSFINHKYILAYNDDEPDDERGANLHSRGAHAKGLVAYDDKNIIWMIHSIPNYPEFKENKEDYILDIDPSQLIYGQSIIILTFPYSDQKLNDIYTQLDVMNAHIYYNCTNYSKKKDSNLIRLIDIAECVQHISKHEKWGKDIFEHLSLSFDTVMLCETWCKPASPSTSLVKNVKTVRWNDQLSYSSTNDHSKYAVSMAEDKPYVFIGDINHMESQTRRGGGGVIIKNKSLWKAFHSIIQNYNDIIENPNYNNDENNDENNDKKCLFLSCFGFCK